MVGWTFAKDGLEKWSPFATPALLIGANLPDAEVVRNLFGGSYLTDHRGLSHTPLGVFALSFCLAGSFWLYGRFRHAKLCAPVKFFPLWSVSLAGLLTHPLLDYLNDYGIRPWLPFNSAKYYGDLLTLFDPWVWLILGCALFLLTQSVRGRIAWLALGLLLAIAVCLGWSLLTGLLWITAIALAIGVGGVLPRHGLNPARIALLVFLLYLGGVAAARYTVVRSAREFGPGFVQGRVEQTDVLPGRPGSFRHWTVVIQTSAKYYIADVGLQDWRRRPPQFDAYAKNLDDPTYQRSLADRDMKILADFARFPAVTVQPVAAGHQVMLRDLRYARQRTEGWGVARATVPEMHTKTQGPVSQFHNP